MLRAQKHSTACKKNLYQQSRLLASKQRAGNSKHKFLPSSKPLKRLFSETHRSRSFWFVRSFWASAFLENGRRTIFKRNRVPTQATPEEVPRNIYALSPSSIETCKRDRYHKRNSVGTFKCAQLNWSFQLAGALLPQSQTEVWLWARFGLLFQEYVPHTDF